MTRPQLDADLLEEYQTLVAKEFGHAMKGKGKTEAEQKAFLKRKIKAKIKQLQELGEQRGNLALGKDIVRLRQDMFRRGVSPLEVSGISSPLRPPPQRRTHNAPVSSGGISAVRGSNSHLQFLQHVGNQKMPRPFSTPQPRKSKRRIGLENVEHYSAKRHSRTEQDIRNSVWGSPVGTRYAHLRSKKMLESEKAGQHPTPPPTRDTSELDQTIAFLSPIPSPTQEFRRIQQGGGRQLDSTLDTTMAGELASFDLSSATLEAPGEHTRIHRGNVRIPDISMETAIDPSEQEEFDVPVGMRELYPPSEDTRIHRGNVRRLDISMETQMSAADLSTVQEQEEETFDKPAGMDLLYPQEEETFDVPKGMDEVFDEVIPPGQGAEEKAAEPQEEESFEDDTPPHRTLRLRDTPLGGHPPVPQPAEKTWDAMEAIPGFKQDPEGREMLRQGRLEEQRIQALEDARREEDEAVDVVRRQESAHRKLHTHPATGEAIPDAPPGAVPISQAAYQESIRLKAHPPPSASEVKLPPPKPPRRKIPPPTPDLNVSRAVGEDLHRSRIIQRGEPRAQTAYFATPEMMMQRRPVTEAGAERPATPARFDAQGIQVGFPSEMRKGKVVYEPSSLAHKHTAPRFESVGTAEYAGGNQSAIHADEPNVRAGGGPRTRGAKDKGPPHWGRDPVPEPTGKSGWGGRDDQPERDRTRDRIDRDYGGPDSPDDSGSGSGSGRGPGRGPIRDPRKPGRGRFPRRHARARGPHFNFAETQPAPVIVHTQQPAIIPVGVGVGGGGGASKEKPGINIKITNKAQAIINEKKKRRKVTTARKEYSKLRRETIKAIRKGKAQHYKAESAKLKAMPVKKQKAARDSLKKKLRLREVRLIGQLPGASKMSVKDLDRVTRIAQKLRW